MIVESGSGSRHRRCYDGTTFYAEYINHFEKEKNYEDVIRQFQLIDKHLKDGNTHLLYHGWDEKRECFWADKETGRSANFWGRSVGWYCCALVDTLDWLKEDADGTMLIEKVKDLAEALVKVQSEKSGVWYHS